jgi:hypothetical protein
MTDENVVPILAGRSITCTALDAFIQDLKLKFQEHMDEENCEPLVFYMALTTATGPVYALLDTTQSPESIRSSEVKAKVFFHLQYELTNDIYQI